jgi:hypothetical protein
MSKLRTSTIQISIWASFFCHIYGVSHLKLIFELIFYLYTQQIHVQTNKIIIIDNLLDMSTLNCKLKKININNSFE